MTRRGAVLRFLCATDRRSDAGSFQLISAARGAGRAGVAMLSPGAPD